MRNTLIILAMLAFFPQAAWANDSSARLEAGGLRLIDDADITMETEDLYISRDQVRVEYVFRNTSSADKSIVVAFPLPKVDMGSLYEGDVGVQSQDPVNFVDFKVLSNGNPVTVRRDVRAWLGGRDITALLKQHNVPLGPFGQNYYSRMEAMSQSAFNALSAAGAFDRQSTRDSARPLWTYQVGYYWQQLFPAGAAVKLTQTYRPVVGVSLGVVDGIFGQEAYAAKLRKDYCMDKSFLRALRRMQENPPEQGIIIGYELGYILTTANNWRGSIGFFRLTVDKGSTKALVSLCAPDIKKTGPTTFSLERQNFTPRRDLKIFFAQYPTE